MKTTINIHYVKRLANGVTMDLGPSIETYETVEAAREEAEEYISSHDCHTATICRVCDDVDDDRYCQIVEDDL